MRVWRVIVTVAVLITLGVVLAAVLASTGGRTRGGTVTVATLPRTSR